MKTKLLIPVILATVMMIGATFAVTPVQKASTVHTTIIAAINNALGTGTGGNGNNLVNRDSNSTFKETVRNQYSWTTYGANGAPGPTTNNNGTLLVNFANAGTPGGAAPTKVTGYLTASQNQTLNAGVGRFTAGTMEIYSGNGTALLKVSTAETGPTVVKTLFTTLGGNGLDLRVNTSANNIGTIQFTVVKVD